MSSSPVDFQIPKCSHGITYGNECPECQTERERDYEARVAKERKIKEEEEILKKEELKRELNYRKEHPEYWLKQYNIPEKYLSSSFDNFIGGNGAIEACLIFPEKDVVLIGKTGCGKTHLAVATIREMVVNKKIENAKFATVPRLLMDIRDCFKDNSIESEKQIVDRYISYPALILDDIGSDRSTEWALETLYLIIDGRDSNLKPTFITTNLTVLEMEKHYGARIASRVAGKSVVNIDMPDFRKKRK